MVLPLLLFCNLQKLKFSKFLDQVFQFYASRLLLDADVAEVVEFRSSLAERGFPATPKSNLQLGLPSVSVEDEYLKLYPKKSIDEINNNPKDGLFVLMANITEIVDDGQWWYPALSATRLLLQTMESITVPAAPDICSMSHHVDKV